MFTNPLSFRDKSDGDGHYWDKGTRFKVFHRLCIGIDVFHEGFHMFQQVYQVYV